MATKLDLYHWQRELARRPRDATRLVVLLKDFSPWNAPGCGLCAGSSPPVAWRGRLERLGDGHSAPSRTARAPGSSVTAVILGRGGTAGGLSSGHAGAWRGAQEGG